MAVVGVGLRLSLLAAAAARHAQPWHSHAPLPPRSLTTFNGGRPATLPQLVASFRIPSAPWSPAPPRHAPSRSRGARYPGPALECGGRARGSGSAAHGPHGPAGQSAPGHLVRLEGRWRRQALGEGAATPGQRDVLGQLGSAGPGRPRCEALATSSPTVYHVNGRKFG